MKVYYNATLKNIVIGGNQHPSGSVWLAFTPDSLYVTGYFVSNNTPAFGKTLVTDVTNESDVAYANKADMLTALGSDFFFLDSGGGANPFDQDLNTTDSPEFVGLNVNSDLDGAVLLGRSKIGSIAEDTACFGHIDRFTGDDATLQIGQDGTVVVKARSSKLLSIQQANNTVAGFDSARIWSVNFGQKIGVKNVTTATYNLSTNDYLLHVTRTETGTCIVTLPTVQAAVGRKVVIKDTGNASNFNITITTEGAETIDGDANLIINSDYNSVTLYSDGNNWFII